MNYKKLLCATFLSVGIATVASAAPLQVIYPRSGGGEERISYQLSVLKLIMDKSGREYEMKADTKASSQGRTVDRLVKQDGITLGWFGTSKEFEEKLLPIRFPLMRGLLGYRLGIIKKENEGKFDSINSKADFLKLSACQGAGWPDTAVLRNGGFKVFENPDYNALFTMTERGRCDFFPRGANEPYAEVESRATSHPSLTVEKSKMVVYKFPMFFFVAKENKELAQALEDGFVKAYEDGSFMELFNSHPSIVAIKEKANLAERKCFYIENPNLTAETEAVPAQYWGGVSAETTGKCDNQLQ